ncbi:hypothetical protein BC830DRAFT_1144018 [Chytriomyces sp. MP71]|nr:hypothetical protein BC830DRAFT_1144018 [Chytriomyces sp. MP71]
MSPTIFPVDVDSTSNTINSILSLINRWEPVAHSACNAVSLSCLLGFLVFVEAPKRYPPERRWHVFTSRANQLLLGMWIFGAAYNIAMIYYDGTGSFSSLTAATVLITGVETCYVWFSWLRATVILGFHTPPRIYHLFKNLTYIIPFSGIVPIILEFLPFNKGSLTAAIMYMLGVGIGGIVTCVVDLFFLYSFIAHARQYSADEKAPAATNTNPSGASTKSKVNELRIIASFGVWSTAFALATLGCFLGAVVCMLLQPGRMEGSVLTAYFVCW